MRGRLGEKVGLNAGRRLTPAHAGKICFRLIRQIRIGAHPCACGKDSKIDADAFALADSPPCMRGRLMLQQPWNVSFRLTPAHAGKIFRKIILSLLFLTTHPRICGEDLLQFARSLAQLGVHPRVCGEDCNCSIFSFKRSGSPPRMRGRFGVICTRRQCFRLTPAHAGKIE